MADIGGSVEDSTFAMIRQSNWYVLADPTWDTSSMTSPPSEMIVGGWMLNDDGSIGPFQPNPHFRPSAETVPTDPVDAILRRIAAGENQLGDELVATIRDTVVEIGCDAQGRPLTGKSPDGVDCAVIATAELQKGRIDVDRWVPLHGAELVDAVPPGVDILLNPAGRAPFRLAASAVASPQ
ncbi:type VII secretion system-associated protein [Nocardia sp. NPDC051463]|uniref:type VII secretion system-associated protein n=1 Tax=Nocardia sp. NPDC051463 TaxID=3154845 RepID=UPI00344BED53